MKENLLTQDTTQKLLSSELCQEKRFEVVLSRVVIGKIISVPTADTVCNLSIYVHFYLKKKPIDFWVWSIRGWFHSCCQKMLSRSRVDALKVFSVVIKL